MPRLHFIRAMRLSDSQTKIKRTTSRAHVNSYTGSKRVSIARFRREFRMSMYMCIYILGMSRRHARASPRDLKRCPQARQLLSRAYERNLFFFWIDEEKEQAGTQAHAHSYADTPLTHTRHPRSATAGLKVRVSSEVEESHQRMKYVFADKVVFCSALRRRPGVLEALAGTIGDVGLA